MTSPDQIQAGKYELVALSWDETTSKPGAPFAYKRHVQGDVVTLDVEQARRLVQAGAVVKPGERERARIEALQAQIAAQLATLPPEIRAQMTAGGLEAPEPEQSTAPGAPVVPPPATQPPPLPGQPPARSAAREEWAAYAKTLGATEADLAGRNRDYIRDLCDLRTSSS